MLPDDSALRRRILLTVALVIILPFVFLYAFVAAINWILLPLLESLGYGPFHGRFYVSPGIAVLLVGGGLLAQLWFGPRTVLSSIGARQVTASTEPELVDRVTRLAQQVDLEPPTVALAENQTPNAAAVEGPRGSTIIVTRGLLDSLEGDELDAVLAHEIAHLKNRDATVMTVAWLLPTITYYLALATATVLYVLYRGMGMGAAGSRGGNRGMGRVLVVMTVTAIVTIAISALFWMASVLVHRTLSRYREYAADRGAAQITGKPIALANALRKLDEQMPEVPDRDLRALDGGGEALYVAPLEGRAFTDAQLVSTEIFPETHPSTADRIEQLQEMAGDLE